MQVPRSLAPWSLCNGLKAVITECSRNLPNNGPVPTIIVPQNILKATVWSRSASGPSADASALNVPFDLEACSSIVMGIWISHMETEKPDVDQSFHVEMVRQLNLLPNKFHQISAEDLDHLNEISIEETERQLSLTSAAMRLFSNFEKLLPIGPIAAKKLGGFASTSKDQPKT
jgi:hypothetical protein